MAEKTGLRPLFLIENGGFRHYSNNKRPIHSPSDMKGLRIRTMGAPLHIKIVSDLGGRPVPISWSKLYEAIESGIVDGQENSIGTFMIPQLENVQNHIVLDAHVYGIYTLLMNEAWYQSLPEDLKTVLNQAKRISAAVNRGLSVSNEITGIRYLRARGVDIYQPSEDEICRFRELTRRSALDWLNTNIGHKWVQGVLEATAVAEEKLGFGPLGSKVQ
jgi:C4-dicarboxylate-binding protein DctP